MYKILYFTFLNIIFIATYGTEKNPAQLSYYMELPAEIKDEIKRSDVLITDIVNSGTLSDIRKAINRLASTSREFRALTLSHIFNNRLIKALYLRAGYFTREPIKDYEAYTKKSRTIVGFYKYSKKDGKCRLSKFVLAFLLATPGSIAWITESIKVLPSQAQNIQDSLSIIVTRLLIASEPFSINSIISWNSPLFSIQKPASLGSQRIFKILIPDTYAYEFIKIFYGFRFSIENLAGIAKKVLLKGSNFNVIDFLVEKHSDEFKGWKQHIDHQIMSITQGVAKIDKPSQGVERFSELLHAQKILKILKEYQEHLAKVKLHS